MKTLVVAILVTFSVFFLDSCGSKNAAPIGGGGATTGAPTKQWTDVKPSPQLCSGTPASTIVGRWTLNQTSGGGVIRDQSLFIQANSLTLTSACTRGSIQATVSVAVPSAFTATTLTFQKGNSSSNNSRQIPCEATLNQGTSTYTITGKCLNININGPHVYKYLGN